MMEDYMKFKLRLFVAGRTPRSERAIANLKRICETELQGEYLVDVIDVLDHPELAEEAKVLATPTLDKLLPPPLRRIVGDLSEIDKVLFGLDLAPVEKKA
jgi:circadian clock protein KaiB